MPWSVAAAVGGAVVSSALAPSGGSSSSGASQADPFASQRAQYQTMLQQLVTNPSSVTQTPGYQFNFQQGMDAVNAGQAATGNLNSGNRELALEQYGQNYATNSYNNQFLQLSQLAGANVGSPGEAGQLTAQQTQQQQQQASALGSTIGNAVSSTAQSYFNQGVGGYTGNTSSAAINGIGNSAGDYYNPNVSDPSLTFSAS